MALLKTIDEHVAPGLSEKETRKRLGIVKILADVGEYFSEIYEGVTSLVRGMKVTGSYFVKRGSTVTQQYPENRATLKMFDNFKGELMLIHDENNQHACNVCNTCARKCPNGSIEVIYKKVEGADGRSKKVLDKYIYHLETCSFCGLCVPSCDQNALRFDQEFEHAVFDRSKLTKVLNKPGSTSKTDNE
jgi:NADH-quinone oxidoreductase subunit I